MSTTGTRPPLFDPEPGSFDDEVDAPRFPHRPGPRGGGQDQPRWVRPFLLGGLVLVAVLSAFSVLGGQDVDATAPVTAAADVAPPVADQVGADGAAAAAPPTADAAATLDPAGADQADQAVAVGDPGASSELSAVPPDAADPDLTQARAFAAQFAHDYLNLDEANPQIRARELRAYLAPWLDPQLGWDGTGQQVAVLTVPVDAHHDDDGITVTVAAQVTGRDAPRWVHLSVPLASDDAGRLAVIAPPAFVARPLAGTPAQPATPDVDADAGADLLPRIQALFTAVATDEVVQLDGVTAPGSQIRGLDGQVSLVAVDGVQVLAGDGEIRTATAQVTWRDEVTGTVLAQAYRLRLRAVDGTLLVDGIDAG